MNNKLRPQILEVFQMNAIQTEQGFTLSLTTPLQNAYQINI